MWTTNHRLAVRPQPKLISCSNTLPFAYLYSYHVLDARLQFVSNIFYSFPLPSLPTLFLFDLPMADTTLHQPPTQSNGKDVEALYQPDPSHPNQVKGTPEVALSTSSSPTNIHDDDLTHSNAPKLSLPRLFWYFFYNFGLFAWGGPVAQIAMIKEQIVIQEKWITLARFQRVFAVYQILPGPEAAELCMFFGCLSAGRMGGIVAGLAFILPGFVLMLAASYLYILAGLENRYFNASFRALQPIVAAMVRDIQKLLHLLKGNLWLT
jgi:chromate transport protein ChrA